MSSAFSHSSLATHFFFIRLFSSYHNIQIFFTLMAIVNDRARWAAGGGACELEKVNAGRAPVKRWPVGVAGEVFAECLCFS